MVSIFFFFKYWPEKKNASRDIIFLGCVHHGQDLVLKCATSVSLMRTGEVNNTLNSVLGVSDYSLYTVFNKFKAKNWGPYQMLYFWFVITFTHFFKYGPYIRAPIFCYNFLKFKTDWKIKANKFRKGCSRFYVDINSSCFIRNLQYR